jgi:hypothetical protein
MATFFFSFPEKLHAKSPDFPEMFLGGENFLSAVLSYWMNYNHFLPFHYLMVIFLTKKDNSSFPKMYTLTQLERI